MPYELQSLKVWLIALAAGVVGVAMTRDGVRWWVFVRYALMAIGVKAAMPTSVSKYNWFGYFAYGLALGLIAGALYFGPASKRARLIALAKGAALGIVVNVALRLVTYV